MARIILGSYMVRYPLAGNLSWALQYLVGFKALGHDIYFVEKYAYPNSCYDPVQKVMSDDCSYGLRTVADLLAQHGLGDKWCFVEQGDRYHGLSKQKIEEIFKTADLYIESGAHGAWNEEAAMAGTTAYIDVDPAYSHFKFYNQLQQGVPLPAYQHYFTIGLNVGKAGNCIPTLGLSWKYLLNPVNTSLFRQTSVSPKAPYATIMNWKSYENVVYLGKEYGQKDLEFEKFIGLPAATSAAMEIAVSGIQPEKAAVLKSKGWRLNDAQQVTITFDAFRQYLSHCKGEFSVCKNVYTATSSGWFSDKSAAYLASGRPVIVQETGFSQHLPVGRGLFAVNSVEEAKEAIACVEADYKKHAGYARQLAADCFEAKKVLNKFLGEIGI